MLEDDLIYDVGLHKGEDTAYYLAKGYRVVAFEADPGLAEQCRVRFAPELNTGRLTIVEGAVSNVDQEAVTFFRHPGKSDWGTTEADLTSRNSGQIEPVEVRRVEMSSVLSDTGVPYFMKIDIEASDAVCLDALLLFDHRPAYVSMEAPATDFAQLTRQLDLLTELGYKRFAVVQQARIPGKRIDTRDRDGKPLHYRFERHSSGAFGSDIEEWLDRDSTIARYRRIVRMHRLLRNDTLLGRHAVTRYLLGGLLGWYDTHAAL